MEEADIVIGLCDRFKCLPSQLLEEDVNILRLMTVYTIAHPQDEYEEEGTDDG